MKCIIGGLLVISLLSQPSISFASPIAVEIIDKEQRINIFTTQNDLLQKNIDYLLNQLSINQRTMANLLKKRINITNSIQCTLNKLALNKSALSKEQMKNFKSYSDYYEINDKELKKILKQIDGVKDLTEVQQEILNGNSDYIKILTKLIEVNNTQIEAIELLEKMVKAGLDVIDSCSISNNVYISMS